MNLSDLGKGYIFLFIAIVAAVLPMAQFETEVEGIDADRVDWTCPVPIRSLNTSTDLEAISQELGDLDAAAEANGEAEPTGRVSGQHPDCQTVSRIQVGISIISLLAAVWFFRRHWIDSADARAEKKFKKIQNRTGRRQH